MSLNPNDSGILNAVLSDATREALIQSHMQLGADRPAAAEIVDLAFHATRQAYVRLSEATDPSPHSGSVLVLAAQLMGAVCETTADAACRILEAMGAESDMTRMEFTIGGDS